MKSVRNTVERLRSLSHQQRRLLAKALILVGAEVLAVRALSYPLLRHRATHRPEVMPVTDADTQILLDDVVWAVGAAGRRIGGGQQCLVQCLAARRMLAEAGIASVLELGAARDDKGAFIAHAWLRVEDRIVVGAVDVDYVAFDKREPGLP